MTPGIFVDRIVRTTQHFDAGVIRQIMMMSGPHAARSRGASVDGVAALACRPT